MTAGDIIREVMLAVMPAYYPDGTLHTVTRVDAANGDVSTVTVDAPIKVQRDVCTEEMRAAPGYSERDVALIVLDQGQTWPDGADSITTHDGLRWRLHAPINRDAADCHWVMRGSPY